ncbi:MAG: Gfo/Idh/MocA family oxidoreductase [Clostridia bacterium]|nr:Gfo/Idh/MocA family oxidoreductase [Clostridia bacterium]
MSKIKVGIFGAGRGMDIARNFLLLNADIVAICDFHEERLKKASKELGDTVSTYSDFDSFIEHDMDAVILANFFHEHTPYAIRCFEKGIHVFSECISNGTMAEGVELVRAFEKSNSIYFLAENYPQMIFNREIKRVVDSGTLGRILYAEGEYNHPGDPREIGFKKTYNYFPGHWRNYLPRTYYVTHSLGPIMHATGATPRQVSALAVYEPFLEDDIPTASRSGDRVAIITTKNDDGSVFRFTGCAAFGGHHNAYRVCGTEGQIENIHGMGGKMVLHYNGWTKPEGADEISMYDAKWHDKDEELIKKSGHGGADFITARMFLECVKEGKQPCHPFDIYSAVTMSSVAILAHRSMLKGGAPFEIPDFKTEGARVMYENDRLSPFPGKNGEEPTLPCCSKPDFRPSDAQMKLFKKEVMGIEE